MKKATFAQARGAIGYLWYDLRNDGNDPGDPEHNFGLLTHAMEPKAAYAAFNTQARYVAPRQFLQQIAGGLNRWFFLFGDEREKLLVFWNDDLSAQNEQILLRLPGATKATQIDINGNASPLPLFNDLAVVTSGKEPRLILAENASSIEPAGLLAGPSRAFFGGPGEETAISCEFTNPAAVPVKVKTTWTLPGATRLVKAAPESLEIPASGRATSTVTVRLPEDDRYVFGRNGKVKMVYEFVGQPYRGSLLVPVHYGTIAIPPGPASDRPADVTLNKREQLTSFIEADPHMTPYRWKGPDDLSASASFHLEKDDLVVRVAVTDNKHWQPGPAADMWMGDSVQCLIAMRDKRAPGSSASLNPTRGNPSSPSGRNLSEHLISWMASDWLSRSRARDVSIQSASREAPSGSMTRRPRRESASTWPLMTMTGTCALTPSRSRPASSPTNPATPPRTSFSKPPTPEAQRSSEKTGRQVQLRRKVHQMPADPARPERPAP